MQFSDFNLKPALLEVLNTIGYEQPSPIQAQSIPPLLEGRDVLGLAQTGTGKTAAFALPTLNHIDLKNQKPQALVLAPTRELAIQVSEAFKKYATHMRGFQVLPIYGGQSMGIQLKQLQRGAHVVVGTPGRVMDHLRRGTLKLDALKTLILDEADEMLRMGFIDDVEWILQHVPKERQTALFSATMPNEIKKVTSNYLNDPVNVKIENATKTVDNIDQAYVYVRTEDKLEALTRILEIEPMDAAIIFVRTKTATVELAEKLEARGMASAGINGDMNQALRERVIAQLKSGKLDIVVATDVAARGIDVPRISHVINYDIPYDAEAYVHRIGRTGRAGRNGKAILFVTPREKRMLRTIERSTRHLIEEMNLPSQASVAEHRLSQFKDSIIKLSLNKDLSGYDQLIDDLQAQAGLTLDNIAKSLAHLLNKEQPFLLKQSNTKLDVFLSKDQDSKPQRESSRNKKSARKQTNINDENLQLTKYRIDVGHAHEVTPREIVGAIANEAGIDSQYIGKIKIFDQFSTIEMPDDLPGDVLRHLKSVRVAQQKLNIALDDSPDARDRKTKKPRHDSKSKRARAPKKNVKAKKPARQKQAK